MSDLCTNMSFFKREKVSFCFVEKCRAGIGRAVYDECFVTIVEHKDSFACLSTKSRDTFHDKDSCSFQFHIPVCIGLLLLQSHLQQDKFHIFIVIHIDKPLNHKT